MKAKLVILAVLVLVSIAFVPCARSQTGTETISLEGFNLTLSEPKVDFPKSIDFKIKAESESDISRITLQYQVDKLSILPVTNVVFPSFEPAPRTEATWEWDMTSTGGLPPGADIRYWWSIEDALGNKVDTLVAEISFDDGRYKWREVESTGFTLYWYDGSNSFAQELISAGEDAIGKLQNEIGASPDRRAEVYIYGSSRALQSSMIFPQEWTGGVSFSDYGIVAIGVSTGQLGWGKRAMAHEMAHLVIHQSIMNGYGVELPTWLDEGLAMYAEGEMESDFASALASAIKRGKLISVQSLASSFSADRDSAILAYAESYSLVKYLLDHKGGRDNMLKMLETMEQGSGYIEALKDVYGLDVATLDAQWRAYLKAGGA